MAFTFTINGHEYTSDPANVTAQEGYRFIGYGYVTALANLAVDIVAVAAQAASSAASALAAPGTNATSTTSMTIGSGTKTFTIQTGKSFVTGNQIMIARTSVSSNWMLGSLTSYNSSTGEMVVEVPSGNTSGGGTFTDWTVSISGPKGSAGSSGSNGVDAVVGIEARSTNTIITSADKGKLFNVSNTYTQTFDPVANLGTNFHCWFRNVGSGTVTLDPNASETIGGVATQALGIGDYVLVVKSGSNLDLFWLSGPARQLITSTQTITVPAGKYRARSKGCGAGGGGGRSSTGTKASGAAYGGYCEEVVAVTPGQSIVCTIGAAGTAAGSDGNNGGNGGNTSFGAFWTANGGEGGKANGDQTAGGTASGGDVNITGQAGVLLSSPGGNQSISGSGPFGTGGFGAAAGSSQEASGYGAGGRSVSSGNVAGAGMPGVIEVEWL